VTPFLGVEHALRVGESEEEGEHRQLGIAMPALASRVDEARPPVASQITSPDPEIAVDPARVASFAFELTDGGARFTHVEHGVFSTSSRRTHPPARQAAVACLRLRATTSRDTPRTDLYA
jgi:hypothetical protein